MVLVVRDVEREIYKWHWGRRGNNYEKSLHYYRGLRRGSLDPS